MNVFPLTRLSCNTLTQPCIPPPCLSHFPFSGYTLIIIFFHSFAYPLPVALSSPPPHSSSTCLVLAQCVLEEVASREPELARLREKAHHLWEGQAAGKGFVHRVSQLSAQYLALSNLSKVMLFPCSNAATLLVPNLYLCVSACEMLQPLTTAIVLHSVTHKHYRNLCPVMLFTPVLLDACHAVFLAVVTFSLN